MVENKGISIWFFIGTLLLIYGIIITASNYAEVEFGAFGRKVVLADVHFGLWWGILLIVIGLMYFMVFRPWKKRNPAS
jgi:hypothetical protein